MVICRNREMACLLCFSYFYDKANADIFLQSRRRVWKSGGIINVEGIWKNLRGPIKVIIEKIRGEVYLMEQDTIEKYKEFKVFF